MHQYGKIETLYNRAEDFTVDKTQLRNPAFGLIGQWTATTKLDGTNIRLMYSLETEEDITFSLGGRTNKAIFSDNHREIFTEIGLSLQSEVEKIMCEFKVPSLTLYGEGTGPGIQKGGGDYSDHVTFTCFDILKGDRRWCDEQEITDMSERLGIARAAILTNPYRRDNCNLWAAEEIVMYVSSGQNVKVNAKNETEAEGIVARPSVPLFDRYGNRVMWKIKASDFRAGKR